MKAARELAGAAWRDPMFMIGFVLSLVAVVLAIVGPWIVPFDPTKTSPNTFAAPSAHHWAGTDNVGMDVFSRTIAAFRIDVSIAVGAVGISFFVGAVFGAIAGYPFESRALRAFSWFVLRIADIMQSFPVFVMALVLVGTFGQGLLSIIVAIAFVSMPAFLRIVRGSMLSTVNGAYIEAAKVLGLSDLRIVVRHALPNSLEAALANISISLGVGVMLTAGLSFVGAGVRPPAAEWGVMISTGSEDLVIGIWWTTLFPGLAMVMTVVGFALLGDGIRGVLDPVARQSTLKWHKVAG